MCVCVLNYTSYFSDQDECNATVNPCGSGGTCKNSIGNFTCICDEGFFLTKSGQNCSGENVNITMEERNPTSAVCSPDSHCWDSLLQSCFSPIHNSTLLTSAAMKDWKCGTFLLCVRKFSSLCLLPADVDECSGRSNDPGICGLQGRCDNTDGGYWCTCLHGYTNYGKENTPCSSEFSASVSYFRLFADR